MSAGRTRWGRSSGLVDDGRNVIRLLVEDPDAVPFIEGLELDDAGVVPPALDHGL